MNEVVKKLYAYPDVMEFNAPISETVAAQWEKLIPPPLMELYRSFNGGEIFIPGTKIWGLTCDKNDIMRQNNSQIRRNFTIPKSYLIFARLNFGDFICINTEAPFDVIQWDHETDEEYDAWDSLTEWINGAVRDYQNYLDGES